MRELNGDGGLGRGEEFGLVGPPRTALFHLFDFVDEFAGLLELPVDRGEAHVGYGINGLEFFHGAQADEAARHFASGFDAKLGDDFVDEALKDLELDRAFLAGLGKTADQFVAVEWFDAPAPLEDAQFDLLDGFVGRVAGGAGEALAAPTDPFAILNQPRVDDAITHVSATGATHSSFTRLIGANTTIGCGVKSLGGVFLSPGSSSHYKEGVKTRVFLVRHGATVLSAEDRFAGATDVELSDVGRQQAFALAKRLADQPIAACYASPLDRTMETARILAKPHDLPVQPGAGFLEINHGVWEGLTRREAETKFGDMYLKWESDPYNFAPDGGETGLAVAARAMPALLHAVGEHAGEMICVVSHKATIRLLLGAILGFDPRRYRDHLDLNPASLTILDFRDAMEARLTLYNDVAHYAADGLAIPPVPGGRLSKVWGDGKK